MSNLFTAIIPEPHTVLGLSLRPFSAGSIILLSRMDNLFVAPIDKETGLRPAASAEDLFTGIWLCSEQFAGTYEQGLAWLQKLPEWREALAQWIREYQKKFGVINLAAKCQAFARYIQEGSMGPRQRAVSNGVPGNSPTLMLPLVQIVKVDLLKNGICSSETEFLNRPWSASLWDWFTLKGLSGQCEILDEAKIDDAFEFAKNLWHQVHGKKKRGEKRAQGKTSAKPNRARRTKIVNRKSVNRKSKGVRRVR